MIVVNCKTKTLTAGKASHPCIVGRESYIPQAQGREGDFKTPLGTYALRYGFYRADRLPKPNCDLTFRAIRDDDGWCDAPEDPAYNMAVRLPYPANHEVMKKDSGVYDIVIVLGHNDDPPAPGLGSAIFLHICHPDHRPTAGCIAVEPDVMVKLLPHLKRGDFIEIKA